MNVSRHKLEIFEIIENEISSDPDKRDYLVSNEKLKLPDGSRLIASMMALMNWSVITRLSRQQSPRTFRLGR